MLTRRSDQRDDDELALAWGELESGQLDSLTCACASALPFNHATGRLHREDRVVAIFSEDELHVDDLVRPYR